MDRSGVVQLPAVPQLRDVKVPVMSVPPFTYKTNVLSPLSATRTFVEVRMQALRRKSHVTSDDENRSCIVS